MIDTTVFDLIGNFGFPIAAFWLMYRMANTTIKDNTAAINRMSDRLESHNYKGKW